MCLITYTIFKDPVIVIDGNTYEREAINTWLNNSKKSPLTNKVLENNISNSNISVRQKLTALAESKH